LAPDERRRQEAADSCIVCHMPRSDSSNVAHAAITDHRVIRRPDQPRPAAPGERPGSFLTAFHRDHSGEREGDPRDLGLALVEVNPYTWQSHGFLAQTLAQREQWGRAVEECRASLRLNPFETRTRMLLIDCLIRAGEKQQARAEFETLSAANPSERERLRRWF